MSAGHAGRLPQPAQIGYGRHAGEFHLDRPQRRLMLQEQVNFVLVGGAKVPGLKGRPARGEKDDSILSLFSTFP